MFKYIKDILEREGIKAYEHKWSHYITLSNADDLLGDEVFCQMLKPKTSPTDEVIVPLSRIEKLFKFVLNEYSQEYEFMNSIVYYNFGKLNGHHRSGSSFNTFFRVPKDREMFIKPIKSLRNRKIDEFDVGKYKIAVYEFAIDVYETTGTKTFELKPLLIPKLNQTVKINPEQLLTPENEPVEARVIRVEGLKCFVRYRDVILKLPLEDIIIDTEKEYIEYIKKSFEEGKIVCMTTSGDDLYTLSVIDQDEPRVYAFVSMTGGSWATGESKHIKNIVAEFLDDIIIFEDKIEYIKYLKEEFLNEI